MRQKIKWSDISKYRNEMFGLAIISIMVLHYCEHVPQAEYIHLFIFKIIARVYCSVIGSVGVDIFLFLSGFGIAYSLRKKPDILVFYRKRFVRVLVPYLILGGIYWIINDFLLLHKNLLVLLYDYSIFSFWLEGVRMYWYISLICFLYLLSPFIFSIGKKGIVIISIISVIFSVGLYFMAPETFYDIEIAVLRIPIYFIGMFCSFFAVDEKKLNLNFIVFGGTLIIILKGITGYFDFAFARLFNAPYAVFLIFLYIYLRKRMEEKNIIQSFLIKAGKYSLELYIIHVALREIIGTLGMPVANPFIYGMCIIVSVFIAIGYAEIHNKIFIRTNQNCRGGYSEL